MGINGLTIPWGRDDALMKANDDVTGAPRRTIALMQGELERSVLSTQMLGELPSDLLEILSLMFFNA
jgi:hypothetical protein